MNRKAATLIVSLLLAAVAVAGTIVNGEKQGGATPAPAGPSYEVRRFLQIDSGGWYGWETGEGPTANNALVLVGYSEPGSAAGGFDRTGWAAFSSQTTLQDKYLYGKIQIPQHVTAWGATALVVRVRSWSTASADNQVDMTISDGTTAASLVDMRSASAGQWNTYTITRAEMLAKDAAWTNLATYAHNDGGRYFEVRLAVAARNSNYAGLPEVFCDWK